MNYKNYISAKNKPVQPEYPVIKLGLKNYIVVEDLQIDGVSYAKVLQNEAMRSGYYVYSTNGILSPEFYSVKRIYEDFFLVKTDKKEVLDSLYVDGDIMPLFDATKTMYLCGKDLPHLIRTSKFKEFVKEDTPASAPNGRGE